MLLFISLMIMLVPFIGVIYFYEDQIGKRQDRQFREEYRDYAFNRWMREAENFRNRHIEVTHAHVNGHYLSHRKSTITI